MEEVTQAPVEQSAKARGEAVILKDSVSIESHQKLLREKKTFQAKAQELESTKSQLEQRLAELEQEKDLASGNKDKVIDEQKKKIDALSSEFEKTKQTYVYKTITSEIKREALRYGCKDPEKLLRLIADEDMRGLEITDDYSISKESLSSLMEKVKKEEYFLFDSSNKAVAAGLPGKKMLDGKPKTDKEIFEAYIKTLK